MIPEEWKSAKRVSEGHRLQLGTYFLLIEEEFGVRPPHGFIVLGDGTREKVKNTEALRSEVLVVAEKIREHRRRTRRRDPGEPTSGQVPRLRPAVKVPSISGLKSVGR